MKVKLNLPEFDIKTRVREGKPQVWDEIRMKWLALTPEEWVRRNVIKFLTVHKNIPPLHIKQEMQLELHGTRKRADIVVFGADASPWMIIECKAPGVKITRETLEQVSRYNMVLGVPYLALTNGLTHYCLRFDVEDGGWKETNFF